MRHPWLVFSFLLFAGVELLGCGARQTPVCDIPERGNLTIEATDRLNPDEQGRALPTIIRLYQLSELGALEMANFQDIWQQAEDTLGDTLIASDEVTVYPGQRVNRTFERDPAANFLVGVAIVRRPSGQSWRTILDMPASAEAQRCAAMQQDPEEPPPQPSVSRVEFRVDMYSIEGTVFLDDSTGSCETGDLECVRNRVEQPDTDVDRPEAPEVDQPSQPQTPTTPTTPGA